MNWKRTKSNLKLLGKLNVTGHGNIAAWSLLEHSLRGTNLEPKMHNNRYSAVKKYLRKEYPEIIQKYRNKKLTNDSFEKIGSQSPIWVFWWQGFDKLPYPVNKSVASIKKYAGNRPVNLITKDNYLEYVDLPDYILEKFKNGSITIAHLSDILRISLLKKYGGIWVDSTLFWTAELPSDVSDLSFYTINQGGGRPWIVSKDKWSICLLAVAANNELINFCWDYLFEYLKKENVILSYLMLDAIIAIGYEDIPAFKNMIDSVPVNNPDAFVFVDDYTDKVVDEEFFSKLIRRNFLFKLTYKINYRVKMNNQETYFGKLIGLLRNDKE